MTAVARSEPDSSTILVVQCKDLFSAFLRHFPVERLKVSFSESTAEVLALSSMLGLRLVVTPTDDAGARLAIAIREVNPCGVSIMGIVQSPEGAGFDPEIYDRVVDGSDIENALAVARELVNERRQLPRVAVTFPVKLGDRGTGVAQDVSIAALRVNTMMPLSTGASVRVEIGWGEKPYCFQAAVGRIQPASYGQRSLVLHVPQQATEVRGYLNELIKKILEVRYYLGISSEGPSALRGPVSWDLARHVEQTLRESEEVESAVVGKAQPKEFPADGIESRYSAGKWIERWGVGDVFSAVHILLKRPITLKVLSEELQTNDDARKRMEQEALTATKVSVPGIVDVVDCGSDGQGGFYYAMEALTGETLARALERGQSFCVRDITRLGVHIAVALGFLHMRDEGHFDLCPKNVFLQQYTGTALWPLLINLRGTLTSAVPSSLHPMGSDFWPPEASAGPTDPIHEVYMLGALLKHLYERCRQSPASPGQSGQRTNDAESLQEIIERATCPSKPNRFRDMVAMALSLGQCLEKMERSSRDQPVLIERPPRPDEVFRPGQRSQKRHTTTEVAEAMSALAMIDPRLLRHDGQDEKGDAGPPLEGKPEQSGRQPAPSAAAASRRALVFSRFSVREAVCMVLLLVSGGLALSWTLHWGSTTVAPPARAVGVPGVPTSAGRHAGTSAAEQGRAADPSSRPFAGPGPPASAREPLEARAKAEPRPEEVDNRTALSTDPQERPSPGQAVTAGNVLSKGRETSEEKQAAPLAQKARKKLRQQEMGLAHRLLERGEKEGALDHLRQALELGDSARLRAAFAQIYERSGQTDKAIEQIKRAIELQSDVAWYQKELGVLYIKTGNAALACQAFQRALTIQPKYQVARARLRKHCPQ